MHHQKSWVILILAIINLVLAIMTLLIGNSTLNFFNSSPLLLIVDGTSHYLPLGQISLATLFVSWLLIAHHIVQELFGFIASILMMIASLISGLMPFVLFKGISLLPFVENQPVFLTHPETSAYFLNVPWLMWGTLFIGGLGTGILMFGLVRKLTRNHAYLVRYLLGSVTGGLALACLPLLVQNSFSLHDGTFLTTSITHTVQLWLLALLFLPFANILKWFLGFILGEDYLESINNKFVRHNLFKPESKDFLEYQSRVSTPGQALDPRFSKAEGFDPARPVPEANERRG